MTDMLPREVLDGLAQARKRDLRRRNRLRVRVGEAVFPILRFHDDGFVLDAEDAPHLRGHVDIYDGGRHLYQALVVAIELEGDQMRYEFKRSTLVTDRAALDYSQEDDAPVALITRN